MQTKLYQFVPREKKGIECVHYKFTQVFQLFPSSKQLLSENKSKKKKWTYNPFKSETTGISSRFLKIQKLYQKEEISSYIHK